MNKKQGGRRTNSSEDISSGQSDRDGLLLDRTWSFETGLEDSHEQLSLEEVVLEFVSFGVEDILKERGREGTKEVSFCEVEVVGAEERQAKASIYLSLRSVVLLGEVELTLPGFRLFARGKRERGGDGSARSSEKEGEEGRKERGHRSFPLVLSLRRVGIRKSEEVTLTLRMMMKPWLLLVVAEGMGRSGGGGGFG